MKDKTLLVGDNPFHGVSHYSQDKARGRESRVTDPEWAAHLVEASFTEGANGFMFSVSQTTLKIISLLPREMKSRRFYAIVPAAADYVRLSSQVGTAGLVKYVAGQTLRTGNFPAIFDGVSGLLRPDAPSLLKAYLGYELSRIHGALGAKPHTLMLHELITEMAVALDLDWLIREHIKYLDSRTVKPGFETRNFARLANKLRELKIDPAGVVITAPFNRLGFQMNPSQAECERAVEQIPGAEIIAMSVLASGRITLPEARQYVDTTPGLSGVVIGVSREEQARQTFRFFSGRGEA